MKLLSLFILAQIIGLLIIVQYIDIEASSQSGTTQVTDAYFVEPPQMNETYSFIFISFAIILGTFFLLLIIKYKLTFIWKVWYFFSIFVALTFGLYAFIPWLWVAIILSFSLAVYKITKQNLFIHNSTELLIYGGLAAIIVPIINVTSAIMLLVLISVYDFWMVFKSKHMVTLAKAQLEQKFFAGIMLTNKISKKPLRNSKPAILGGGDIAFPLIVAGAFMKSTGSVSSGILISIGATIGLIVLFSLMKKNSFYPAMPFISGGILCMLPLLT